ncbi:MAG: restriction endonuclease subunit S [Gammaproteobacteria bacterium]|nr:restriction endonuclease subunit S [Gammaproteobacteria bacterium]
MNGEHLLALYDQVAEAPDAVSQLRRFVLDLAVRGKLVEQDLSYETATSILAHRRILVSNSEPFDIPSSWAWVNVGAVAKTRLGKMLDKAKNKGIPQRYLRNINVRWFDFDLSDVLEMRFADTELKEFSLRAGDVLICEGGEPGRAAVWDERESEIYFQKAIHRVRFSDIVDSQFFVNALRASADDGRLAEHFTGTGIKHLTGKGLRAYLFPLPPLPEQHRIVAKVDELMALCDRLEKARTERKEARAQLTKTTLARLSKPDANTATFRSHARFAIEALPALTTRADQLKHLRQTILNLAVRGKLVKQNPKDEPASELLKQIAASQARLLKTGQLQTFKRPALVVPFGLPQSWEWAPLGKIFLYDAGIKRAPKELDPSSWLLELEDIEKESGRLVARVHAKDRKSKSTKSEFQEGDILYGKLRPYLNKVLVADSAGYSTTEIVAIRPIAALNPEYCALALRRPDFVEYVTRLGQGTKMPRLRRNDAINAPFPLAPVAEQGRIVAKVNEMMTLCDQLEAGLGTLHYTHTQLLESALVETVRRAA